jgi:DNA-binding Lrp family transcriptional regulator
MIVSNNAQISNLELKILNELKKNCRANLDDIAKKCGCSRYKVGRVIKKFEDNNTIIGYSAIINPGKIKLKHYILLIKRTKLPLDEDFLKKLPVNETTDVLPEIKVNIDHNELLYVHGNFDWVASFTTEDISNAKEFCNQILRVYHKYVDRLELLEIVKPIRINGFKISQTNIMSDVL